jgi:hypothetical protein
VLTAVTIVAYIAKASRQVYRPICDRESSASDSGILGHVFRRQMAWASSWCSAKHRLRYAYAGFSLCSRRPSCGPVRIGGWIWSAAVAGEGDCCPGRVGVVEATMVDLYHSPNIRSHIAVVVVLAYRLLSFGLPTFLGIALMPYLNRRYNRATHER